MNRRNRWNALAVLILLAAALLAWGQGEIRGQGAPRFAGVDPFGPDPDEAFVFDVGCAIVEEGVVVSSGARLRVLPFFTTGWTEIPILPAFSARHTLSTGLDFTWWSAMASIDLSLIPWTLLSTGGEIMLHPVPWVLANDPHLALVWTLGWGPEWNPAAGWTHAAVGTADVGAVWRLNTVWDSSLDVELRTFLDGEWRISEGGWGIDWVALASAESVLPLFRESPAMLRATGTVRSFLLPALGVGFDLRLDFRLHNFTAYATAGFVGGGIRAELGVNMTFGFGGQVRD